MFLCCRYRYLQVEETRYTVAEEIHIQSKPCDLNVNRFHIFVFQYSESHMEHLENWRSLNICLLFYIPKIPANCAGHFTANTCE